MEAIILFLTKTIEFKFYEILFIGLIILLVTWRLINE